MELIHVAVAVLSLLSVGHSAPATNCESLIQPVEIQRDRLLGKWIFQAESTTIPGSQLLTKMFVESFWAKYTAVDESDVVNAFYAQKIHGRCFSLSVNYTLVNNTFEMLRPYPASGFLLKTGCPDCIVSHARYTFGQRTYAGLQLLSKRRKVTAAEMEEFKKQAECMNLPQPAVLDPEKDLCPDESPSQETETTDLTSAIHAMGSEALGFFSELLDSEGGVSSIVKLLSSSIPGLKQD